MIWLTWRQFRAQAITAAAALAAFAIVLAAAEPSLSGVYHSSGFASCHGAACTGLASTFINDLASGGGIAGVPGSAYMILYLLSVVVILIAPAIIGIFWGAPLIARELEAGTFRLTWNQSVTRTRWLAVKLALIGVAAMAVTEAFSLIQAWWAAPIGRAVGLGGSGSILDETRFGVFVFPTHGITPLGYAAFGFALGVTVGLLVRRAIPAMAITLAIFAAAQLITPALIRPNLFPTSRTIATIAAAGANVSSQGQPQAGVHRHRRPRPARSLDHLQRRRQRRRAAGQHHSRGLRAGGIADIPRGQGTSRDWAWRTARPGEQLRSQPRDPGRRKLPARQPLLAPPVVRDRHVPGPRPGPDLLLLLAAQPPPFLTRRRVPIRRSADGAPAHGIRVQIGGCARVVGVTG